MNTKFNKLPTLSNSAKNSLPTVATPKPKNNIKRHSNNYPDAGPKNKRQTLFVKTAEALNKSNVINSPTQLIAGGTGINSTNNQSQQQQHAVPFHLQPNQLYQNVLPNPGRATTNRYSKPNYMGIQQNNINFNRLSPSYLRTNSYLPSYTSTSQSSIEPDSNNYSIRNYNLPTNPSPSRSNIQNLNITPTNKNQNKSVIIRKAKGNGRANLIDSNKTSEAKSSPRGFLDRFRNDEITITPVRISNNSNNRTNKLETAAATKTLATPTTTKIVATKPVTTKPVATKSVATKAPVTKTVATPTPLWNKEDALKAHNLEKEIIDAKTGQTLMLKFPDLELNKSIVHSYAPLYIDKVHFQQPSTPRYCFVQLHKDANVEEAIKTISKIKFGNGTIKAEIKKPQCPSTTASLENIDPLTLYVGNLPSTIQIQKIKSYFPTAAKVNVAFSKRMKLTRYAFIKYDSVEASMEAFRKTHNLELDTTRLIVRFRRTKNSTGTNDKPLDDVDSDAQAPDEPVFTVEHESDSNSRTSELNDNLDTKENILAEANILMAANEAAMQPNVTNNADTTINDTQSTLSTTVKSDGSTNEFNLLGTKLKLEVLDPEFSTQNNSDEEFSSNAPIDDDSDYEEQYRNRHNDNIHNDSDSDDYNRTSLEQQSSLPAVKEEKDENYQSSMENSSKVVGNRNGWQKTQEELEIDRLFDALNSDDEY